MTTFLILKLSNPPKPFQPLKLLKVHSKMQKMMRLDFEIQKIYIHLLTACQWFSMPMFWALNWPWTDPELSSLSSRATRRWHPRRRSQLLGRPGGGSWYTQWCNLRIHGDGPTGMVISACHILQTNWLFGIIQVGLLRTLHRKLYRTRW